MVDLNNYYKNNTSNNPPAHSSLPPSLPPSRMMIHMNHILYITLSPLSPVSRCVCMHTHTTCSLSLSLSLISDCSRGGLRRPAKNSQSKYPRKSALLNTIYRHWTSEKKMCLALAVQALVACQPLLVLHCVAGPL